MKIRKSDLRVLVEEVMNEKNVQIYGTNPTSFTNKAGLAKQDPKKMAKGGVTGPPPNQKQITNLSAGTNGWSGLVNKLDGNVAALKKAKAIDAATAKKLNSQISQMIKTFRAGAKTQADKWKKTGKQ